MFPRTIELIHSAYLAQYKSHFFAEELLFKSHRHLNFNVQNLDKIEQSSPKEHHVIISRSVSVPLSLTENKPISHAQSKMTTMISLEL